MAVTLEAKEKVAEMEKKGFFPPSISCSQLHAQYTSVFWSRHRRSVRGKWSKAIRCNAKNPKDE